MATPLIQRVAPFSASVASWRNFAATWLPAFGLEKSREAPHSMQYSTPPGLMAWHSEQVTVPDGTGAPDPRPAGSSTSLPPQDSHRAAGVEAWTRQTWPQSSHWAEELFDAFIDPSNCE